MKLIPGAAMKKPHWYSVLVTAANRWSSDNASTLGATLAFYCAFSLAPLLVLLLSAVGAVAGEEMAYGYVGNQLTSLFGSSTSDVLLEAARQSQSTGGVIANVVSGVTLLIGATTVFAALDSALELIWGSERLALGGVRGFIKTRLISVGFILAIGFLLIVSLAISTALSSFRTAIFADGLIVVAVALEFILTTTLLSSLFALIYRYMPSRRVAWRFVIVGAIATALLFQVGRWLIGLYLGRSTQPSAFGAASSFVALLLWLYYSAQIFLFGAEFTSCYAGLREPDSKKPKR
jgi:membrane protein